MSIEVTPGLIRSADTEHHALPAGQGLWAVSYLPGRIFSTEQAVKAIEIACYTAYLADSARALGLTGGEAIGLATAIPATLAQTYRPDSARTKH
jgi:hypothetical protein